MGFDGFEPSITFTQKNLIILVKLLYAPKSDYGFAPLHSFLNHSCHHSYLRNLSFLFDGDCQSRNWTCTLKLHRWAIWHHARLSHNGHLKVGYLYLWEDPTTRLDGFEPPTLWLTAKCSANWATVSHHTGNSSMARSFHELCLTKNQNRSLLL